MLPLIPPSAPDGQSPPLGVTQKSLPAALDIVRSFETALPRRLEGRTSVNPIPSCSARVLSDGVLGPPAGRPRLAEVI